MSNDWRIWKGELTEMPNPTNEEAEKEIHRLQLLAVPFVDKIMPKLRTLAPVTKGLSPGKYIPLAIGVLIEELGLTGELRGEEENA